MKSFAFEMSPTRLAGAALLGLLLGVAGCGDEPHDGHCDLYGSLRSSSMEITAPYTAPMRLTLETCRLDAETCSSLCDQLMIERQLFEHQLECKVAFRAESVLVEVLHVDVSDCEGVIDVPLPEPFPGRPGGI